jgi:hypothetical protein
MFGSEIREKSQVKVVSEKTSALYLRLRENEPDPPERLFHYTNSQGLLGIVTSQKLWASHADFLNDSSEPEYAFDVLKDSLNEIVRSLEHASIAARWLSGVWDYVEDEYKKHGPHVYVSCFCEDGDLLSQWRGYGSQCAGYALGFSGPGLRKLLIPGEGQFMMKIVYDKQKQRDEAKHVLKQIVSIANEVETSLPDTEAASIGGLLRSAIFAEVIRLRAKFKMKAFEREEEWRIVQFMPSASDVKFRANAEVIKPYLELDPGKLPIDQVTIGPTRDKGLSSQSLNLLFTNCGYSNLCLEKSGVPYRQ